MARHAKQSQFWTYAIIIGGLALSIFLVWYIFATVGDEEYAGQRPAGSVTVSNEPSPAPVPETSTPEIGPEKPSQSATKSPVTRSTKTPSPPVQTMSPDYTPAPSSGY